MELHFETIMRAAEQQLANEAHQLVTTDHKTAVKLVEIAIDKIADSYNTAQKLTILAGVRDIDELDMDSNAFAVRKVSQAATMMLKSCIAQRLDMVASAINVAVFGQGVLPAADTFIKLAEAATCSERWLPEDEVVLMRATYDRLYSGEGDKDDLIALLAGAALFDKIIDDKRRLELCDQHGLEFHDIKQAAKELKFYRNLLRPGWPLIATAFDQLNDQQSRDVGLPTERVAPGFK